MFKVLNKNNRTNSVFIGLEYILHLFRVSIADFKQVNVSWKSA